MQLHLFETKKPPSTRQEEAIVRRAKLPACIKRLERELARLKALL